MKVVLDTNVLVSGLMTRAGTCAAILNLAVDGRITAVLDARISDEYRRTCLSPRLRLDTGAVLGFLRLLEDCAESVTAMPLKSTLPDPDDLPFLEVAAASHAVLVTGNTRHFPPKAVGSVRVSTPRDFLDALRT